MFALSITTERLTLRPYTLADAPRVRELANEWEIARMLSRMPHPYPEGEAERWIATHPERRAGGKGVVFAIEIDGACAGSIGLERDRTEDLELGYWIGLPYWNRGYVTEAARAVVEFGFEWLNAPKIVSGHLPENLASGRVLQKVGFRPCGEHRIASRAQRCEVTCTSMELTRDAWLAARRSAARG